MSDVIARGGAALQEFAMKKIAKFIIYVGIFIAMLAVLDWRTICVVVAERLTRQADHSRKDTHP